MSIDERIRAGLAANADLPQPPVEHHLDRVDVRHRRRVRLKVAGGVAALALVVALPLTIVNTVSKRSQEPVSPNPPTLPGSYQVRVVGDAETESMTGTWEVTLHSNGQIAIDPPAGYSGPAPEEASAYEHEGGEFTTNVFLAWPGCQRVDPPIGTYRVDLTESSAIFSLVSDACAARIQLFGTVWERVR